jgi:hypothetical protein
MIWRACYTRHPSFWPLPTFQLSVTQPCKSLASIFSAAKSKLRQPYSIARTAWVSAILNVQVRLERKDDCARSRKLHSPPTRTHCQMGEPKADKALERLRLASQASLQYLDLEGAENGLATWIRNANRGPQSASEGTITPGKLQDVLLSPCILLL